MEEMIPPQALVIDENEDIRKLIAVNLKRRLGLDATEAKSTTEAIELLKNQKFSLVICKLGAVPSLGSELSQKTESLVPSMRIIFYSFPEVHDRGRNLTKFNLVEILNPDFEELLIAAGKLLDEKSIEHFKTRMN